MKKRVLVGAACVAGGIALGLAVTPVPSFEAFKREASSSDTALLSQEGDTLQTLRVNADVQRDGWVSLADIAAPAKLAILQAEDRDFYHHGAVDVPAAAQAVYSNIRGLPRRGASTIAMQVADIVGNVKKGAAERSWWSKFRQVGQAVKLEMLWSKDQIFETYLNSVYFRGELQGIGAASRFMLKKAPATLSSEEAAVLAVLIRSPNAKPERVIARVRTLISTLAPDKLDETSIDNLVYTSVYYRKENTLQVGLAPHLAARLIGKAVAPVSTSIQAGLQRYAVSMLEARMLELEAHSVQDAAVVVLDNRTGRVLAYVGTSARTSNSPEVDTVTAMRQAGSTLKPFLYGLAFENRLLTPASLIRDEPLALSSEGRVYSPQNYDNSYRGLVSARTALASSLNIPAVKTLEVVGADNFVSRLVQLGLAVPEEGEYYGGGLALGSLDVSLLTLTNAYRVLANEGKVGEVCFEKDCARPLSAQVYSAAVTYQIASVLSDNNARTPTFGTNSILRTPYWTAVKTGTSKDMRDNWAIGFSSRYTVGVWVGNASGEPMHSVSGISGAAPLWRDLMDYLNKTSASARPVRPAGLVEQAVTFMPAVEAPRSEFFVPGTERDLVYGVQEQDAFAAKQVHILRPVAGAKIVYDPDIPASKQRLVLKSQVSKGVSWQMDGAALTSPSWELVAGKHKVVLLDSGTGAVLDEINFEVRRPGPAK